MMQSRLLFYHPEPLAEEHLDDYKAYVWGPENWTIQAWKRLKDAGTHFPLTSRLPESGVVVAHRNHLPDSVRPTLSRFIVCIEADQGRHPFSNVDIVQNLNEESLGGDCLRVYIPHFPQMDLKPRDSRRGDRFTTIGFFGHLRNLACELSDQSFLRWLREHGLELKAVSDYRDWNDYSRMDAVLAVRSFDSGDWGNKPATKLYNAWLAGVPAVLGRESAYRAHRESELDFLEIQSVDDVKQALLRLKENPSLRRSMVENGLIRGRAYTAERTTERWEHVLKRIVMPRAQRWFSSSMLRTRFLLRRKCSHLPGAVRRSSSAQIRALLQKGF